MIKTTNLTSGIDGFLEFCVVNGESLFDESLVRKREKDYTHVHVSRLPENFLGNLRNIRKLDLSFDRSNYNHKVVLSKQYCKRIALALNKSCNSIESLSLANVNLTPVKMRLFVRNLAWNATLTHLDISDNPKLFNGVNYLDFLLQKLPKLVYFNCANCSLNAESCVDLAKNLSQLSHLKHLYLQGNHMYLDQESDFSERSAFVPETILSDYVDAQWFEQLESLGLQEFEPILARKQFANLKHLYLMCEQGLPNPTQLVEAFKNHHLQLKSVILSDRIKPVIERYTTIMRAERNLSETRNWENLLIFCSQIARRVHVNREFFNSCRVMQKCTKILQSISNLCSLHATKSKGNGSASWQEREQFLCTMFQHKNIRYFYTSTPLRRNTKELEQYLRANTSLIHLSWHNEHFERKVLERNRKLLPQNYTSVFHDYVVPLHALVGANAYVYMWIINFIAPYHLVPDKQKIKIIQSILDRIESIN